MSDSGSKNEAVHGVVCQLLHGIVRKEQETGDAITVGWVSKNHGVNEQTAAAAVQWLTGRGIVRNRQRTGAVVQPREAWDYVDQDLLSRLLDLEEIGALKIVQEARLGMEPLAARAAAQRISFHDHDLLMALSLKIFDIGSAPDFPKNVREFGEADKQYHGAIFSASRNPVFIHFVGVIKKSLDKRLYGKQPSPLRQDDAADSYLTRPTGLALLLHVGQAKAIVTGQPSAAELLTRGLLAEFNGGLEGLYDTDSVGRAIRGLPWTSEEERRFSPLIDQHFNSNAE